MLDSSEEHSGVWVMGFLLYPFSVCVFLITCYLARHRTSPSTLSLALPSWKRDRVLVKHKESLFFARSPPHVMEGRRKPVQGDGVARPKASCLRKRYRLVFRRRIYVRYVRAKRAHSKKKKETSEHSAKLCHTRSLGTVIVSSSSPKESTVTCDRTSKRMKKARARRNQERRRAKEDGGAERKQRVPSVRRLGPPCQKIEAFGSTKKTDSEHPREGERGSLAKLSRAGSRASPPKRVVNVTDVLRG